MIVRVRDGRLAIYICSRAVGITGPGTSVLTSDVVLLARLYSDDKVKSSRTIALVDEDLGVGPEGFV